MAIERKIDFNDPAPILDDEDEEALDAIDEGIRDADAGRTAPIEEVRKRLVEQSDLGGLARSFNTLEGDEEPACYRAASLKTRTRRFGSTPVDRD